MKAQLERHGDDWRVITSEETFEVSSINAHCESKLKAMLDKGGVVYAHFEAIIEYTSDEYRARISASDDDWYDEYEDVACLLRDYVDPDQVGSYVDELMRNATATAFIPFPKG